MSQFAIDGLTDAETRSASARFARRFGYTPTFDQLCEFIGAENRFVQCCFAGNSRFYTYELADGQVAVPGDYVMVWSPISHQNEIVRVMAVGPGSWTGATKTATKLDVEWGTDDPRNP